MTGVVLVVPDLVISFIKRVKRWGGARLSIFRELLSDARRELARLSLQHPSLGLSKTAGDPSSRTAPSVLLRLGLELKTVQQGTQRVGHSPSLPCDE